MFVHAIIEAIAFTAFLALIIVAPGIAVLYSDWKHKRGWFRE